MIYTIPMRKIGIFSGSFDPVHKGHIAFAKEAMRVCKLDEVVFMPERFPRGKPHVSPISERITELEIALADTPFAIVDAHTDQFTVAETLTELEILYPEAEFTFLIGSDVALHLQNWENIDQLTSKYKFAVGMRAGVDETVLTGLLSSLKASYELIETEYSHLSSSNMRNL